MNHRYTWPADLILVPRLAETLPAGKAAQRDADPLDGPEEALLGGVKVWKVICGFKWVISVVKLLFDLKSIVTVVPEDQCFDLSVKFAEVSDKFVERQRTIKVGICRQNDVYYGKSIGRISKILPD